MDKRALQLGRFEQGDQQMPRTNLRFPKQQRRIMPASVESVGDLIGNARHFRLIFAKAIDDGYHIAEQLGAIQLKMIGSQSYVGPVPLNQMQHPMTEFDVAIARTFSLPQRLNKRFVTDSIEFAGDRLDANVRAHCSRVWQPSIDRASCG